MRTTFKFAAGLALAGILTVAAATPGQARWHAWQGAAAGFAAGAVVGAAAANNSYYGPGYYDYGYAPGYAYAPGYTYPAGTAMEGDYYAYSPAEPAYGYGYVSGGDRWSREHSTNNFGISSQR